MEWLKEILPDAGRVVTDGIEERYLSDTLGRLRAARRRLCLQKARRRSAAFCGKRTAAAFP